MAHVTQSLSLQHYTDLSFKSPVLSQIYQTSPWRRQLCLCRSLVQFFIAHVRYASFTARIRRLESCMYFTASFIHELLRILWDRGFTAISISHKLPSQRLEHHGTDSRQNSCIPFNKSYDQFLGIDYILNSASTPPRMFEIGRGGRVCKARPEATLLFVKHSRPKTDDDTFAAIFCSPKKLKRTLEHSRQVRHHGKS